MIGHLLPRTLLKPLLGAAVLAAVLVVGAHARPADAATGTVEVEFYGVQFDNIDDGLTGCNPFCVTDTHAEVYATMRASTSSGGYGVRNLAGQGSQPSWCKPSKGWYSAGVGPCFRDVDGYPGYANPHTYRLADTTLCTAATPGGSCLSSYQFNNNKIRMSIKPGDTINIALTVMDYDWGSADDVICKVNAKIDPYAWNPYGYSVLHSPWNGHGECHVLVDYRFV
jgi:hypothetical protein